MGQLHRVEFAGHDGSLLAARLDVPVAPPRAWALFAHCFSCSKDIYAAREITAALVEQSIGVLRFDFTGLGNSEGDFSNTNFSTNVQDLVAAAAWLEAAHGGPQLLVGHSLGGAAVIVAAHEIAQVKAVATIGAPSDAAHVIHAIRTHVETIEDEGEAEVELAGRPFVLKRQFLDDVRGAKVTAAAAGLKQCDGPVRGGAPSEILYQPRQGRPFAERAGRCTAGRKNDRRMGRTLYFRGRCCSARAGDRRDA